METILLKKPKYEWANKLSFEQRSLAICKYLEGYAVKPISEWLCVSNTTIEYHLQKEGVYVKYRRPTMFVEVNPLPSANTITVKRVLTTTAIVPQDTKQYYFDEFGERYQRPKTYAEIMRAARNRDRLRLAQQPKREEEQKPTGFLIRMSIATGNRIVRKEDGSYEFHQGSTQPDGFSTSSSTFSI